MLSLGLIAALTALAAPLELAAELAGIPGGRAAGSAGGDAAQQRVALALEQAGYRPEIVTPAPGEGYVLACQRGGEPLAPALALASGEATLVLAHTDAVHPLVPGAVDNAGTVAAAAEVAGRLARDPPAHPVCFGFPDGEELGLLGARRLAGEGAGWGLVIAGEFMGQGQLVAAAQGLAWGAARLRWLSGLGVAEVPYAYRVVARALPWATARSDHAPFQAQGDPALFLVGRDEDGVYWPYHTARDLPGALSPAALEAATDALERAARAGAPPAEAPGDPAVVVPWLGWVLPGHAVSGLTLLGCLLGGLSLVRGGRAAPGRPRQTALLQGVKGLLLGLAAALTAALGPGWLAWAIAARGRAGEGALAEPLTLAWYGGALAGLAAFCGLAPQGLRAAAAAAALTTGLAWSAEVTLALPFALGAAGLWLARLGHERNGAARAAWPAILLALPAPIYLSSPDLWRELVFHGLLPAAPGWWMPARALAWWPLACAALALPPAARRLRWLGAGLAVAGVAWAWAIDPWSGGYFQREMLWPG